MCKIQLTMNGKDVPKLLISDALPFTYIFGKDIPANDSEGDHQFHSSPKNDNKYLSERETIATNNNDMFCPSGGISCYNCYLARLRQ